jgi:RNA polymerase sigma-70 factor (ECF subfamily)
MGATLQADDRCDCTRTLADLLYADDNTAASVPETNWVALVQSVAAHDHNALHALYALYQRTHRIVFTLIMRLTDNRPVAEQLTLEVYQDVWRQAPLYPEAGGSVVAWIMARARSRAVAWSQARPARMPPAACGAWPTAVARSSEATDDPIDAGPLVRGALAVLAPEERQAIETAFFSECSYVEAAAQLNQPIGAVEARIRSGLEKLQRAAASDMQAS